ncbi:hypothetical protein U1Q18_028048 [Sarracenia purpurea var. burkii]
MENGTTTLDGKHEEEEEAVEGVHKEKEEEEMAIGRRGGGGPDMAVATMRREKGDGWRDATVRAVQRRRRWREAAW